MHKPALAEELNTLLALESRSLLRHLDEARPFLSAATFKVWADIERAAARSQDHVRRVSELTESLKLPARAPGFASTVANYHFVSVESVLPLLIQEKAALAASLERAVAHAADHPPLAAALRAMRDDTRELLRVLQNHQKALTAKPPAPAAPTPIPTAVPTAPVPKAETAA
jgi:hypothetical protein